MMRDRVLQLALTVLVYASVVAAPAFVEGASPDSFESQPSVRLGAVAYSPGTVTIFEGIRRYFAKHDFTVDFVLYSNYDALVAALDAGHVDVAWNTPLAHAQFHVRNACQSQTLVMRDVDRAYRSVLVVRRDAKIESLGDLSGKTVVLGSNQSAEATVLPRYYLAQQGVDLSSTKILSLDGRVDLEGNPCASERHVLEELLAGNGDAGVIGERLWKAIRDGRVKGGEQLDVIWTSPAFSHCVFTAAESFDRDLGARFSELMLAMGKDDPVTAEILRLEGAECWVAGAPDGFVDLVAALQAAEGE